MSGNLIGKSCLPQLCLQQGDTFMLNFQYKEDGQQTVLPEGYDLIVGLYDNQDHLIQSGKLSEGTVTLQGDGLYQMAISHESSVKMTKQVILELTIVNENKTIVDHASDIVYINFEYRRNNRLI